MDSVVGALVQNVGGKALKKMKSTVSGTVEHAVIAIIDQRDKQVDEKQNTNGSLSVSSIATGITDKIKETASKVAPGVTSFVTGMLDGADMGENVKKYEVQFNPTTLKLTAQAVTQKSRTSLEENKETMEYGANDATYTLSVQLIVDESNAILQTEGNVQTEAEGFIAALSNENTRALLFMWGDMTYEGILNGVEVNYTMFDTNGIPIRGEINLSIIMCALMSSSTPSADRPLGAWQSAYDGLIAGNGNLGSSTGSSIQKALLCVNNLTRVQQNEKNKLDANHGKTTALALEKAFSKGTTSGGFSQTAVSNGYKVLTVQYNPEELSFQSSPDDDGKAESAKVDKTLSQAVKTIMTVKLTVENIQDTDAFIWDKQKAVFRGSTKERIMNSSIASVLKNYTVKDKIDGLLALMSNTMTRNVVFCWGKLSVSGMLLSEEAEYTMFNTSGNPIMGTVTMKLVLNSSIRDAGDFDKLFKVKHMNVMENINTTAGTITQLVQFNK